MKAKTITDALEQWSDERFSDYEETIERLGNDLNYADQVYKEQQDEIYDLQTMIEHLEVMNSSKQKEINNLRLENTFLKMCKRRL